MAEIEHEIHASIPIGFGAFFFEAFPNRKVKATSIL